MSVKHQKSRLEAELTNQDRKEGDRDELNGQNGKEGDRDFQARDELNGQNGKDGLNGQDGGFVERGRVFQARVCHL